MLISLDYDDTYTKNPGFWNSFIDMCKRNEDVEIVMVTFRNDNEIESMRVSRQIKIFNTSRKAKRKYMKELGYEVDIWIDDYPETILMDFE